MSSHMKERTGGRRKCLPLSRKAKYEFQNAKVRRFEVSINNDYSQFKKRKKQPYVKIAGNVLERIINILVQLPPLDTSHLRTRH